MYRLDSQSVWHDDFDSIAYLDAPDLATYLGLVREANPEHVPVYFVLQYFWGQWVGTSAETVRLLSILLGIATLPFLFLLGRDLFGKGAGLLAALCFALSPAHIFHDQGMRPYVLVTLLAAVSVCSLVRLCRGGGLPWWCIHVLANLLLLWSHVFGVLLLAAEGVFLLLCCWHRLRRTVIWAGLHAAVLAPFLVYVARMPRLGPEMYEGYFRAPPALSVLVDLVGEDAVPLNIEIAAPLATWRFVPAGLADFLASLHGVFDYGVMLLLCLGVVWLLIRILLLLGTRGPENRDSLEGSLLLVFVWALPVVTLTVLSYLWRPCIFPRYTLYSSLALYVMAGGALARMPFVALRRILVTALLLVYGYQLVFFLPSTTRTDWRGVARHIDAHGTPNDVILVGAVPGPAFGALHLALFEDIGMGKRPVAGAHTLQAVCDKSVCVFRRQHAPNVSVWAVLQRDYDFGHLDSLEAGLRQRGLEFDFIEFLAMEHITVYRIRPGAQFNRVRARRAPPLPEAVDYAELLEYLQGPVQHPLEAKKAMAVLRRVYDTPVGAENDWLFGLRARLLVDEGHPELALAAAQKALERLPGNRNALLASAVAQMQTRRDAGARMAFRKILEEGGPWRRLLRPFYVAYFEREDLEAARAAAKRLRHSGLRLPHQFFAKLGLAPGITPCGLYRPALRNAAAYPAGASSRIFTISSR